MGDRIKKNFEKRFGNRIYRFFLDKPLSPFEQRLQNQKINKAFLAVLTGLLGRKPTQDEILGKVDISKTIAIAKQKEEVFDDV
ncbi:MAG: hypothetical protein KAX15_01335 [Candidatus Omnitrophica bacterium]|nr:hypothetical protein [Candidatus Omnitrophota bacterium]